MKIVEGDLLKMAEKGEFDIIIHGCNCFCQMGAGIAKQIALRFPHAYDSDLLTVPGDKSKLGTFTCAITTNNYGNDLTIINLYTQYRYGSKESDFDYDAFRTGLRNVNRYLAANYNEKNCRVGMPMIGSGLAKGNWEKIKEIIEDELSDVPHLTIVKYRRKK